MLLKSSTLWGLKKELEISKEKKTNCSNFGSLNARSLPGSPWYPWWIQPPWKLRRNRNNSGLFGFVNSIARFLKDGKEWTNLLEVWEFGVPENHLESLILMNCWCSVYKFKKCNMFDVLCTVRLDKTFCNQQAFQKTDFTLEV